MQDGACFTDPLVRRIPCLPDVQSKKLGPCLNSAHCLHRHARLLETWKALNIAENRPALRVFTIRKPFRMRRLLAAQKIDRPPAPNYERCFDLLRRLSKVLLSCSRPAGTSSIRKRVLADLAPQAENVGNHRGLDGTDIMIEVEKHVRAVGPQLRLIKNLLEPQ